MPNRLLLIEDDPALHEMLRLHFEEAGYAVLGAANGQEGLALARSQPCYLILLDQCLPDAKGSELIEALLAVDAERPILMMTAQHDLELAIDAIQRGAADFVHKPVRAAALTETVERLLRQRAQAREAQAAEPGSVAEASPPGLARDLIGRSPAMLEVSKGIGLCARSGVSVLISGESRTGKEVVARLIHQHSGRDGPFVAVNCAAIVDTLLESELFGHEKGAFTGATTRKVGKFEQAQDGTLFLDEIGELAPALQAKLLRALQERVFERVGGSSSIATNARLIAATNRDLRAKAAAGCFREDLLYRLEVVRIQVPPLRERREDIPLLAEGLLERLATRLQRPRVPLAEDARAALLGHDWPGNVRELENMLTQAMLRARHGLITAEMFDWPAPTGRADDRGLVRSGARSHAGLGAGLDAGLDIGADTPQRLPESVAAKSVALKSLAELEAEHVQRVLDFTHGHKGRACEILGISRPALDRKIEKYRLRWSGKTGMTESDSPS
ncbi:Transcriptional regulatory protein ZraR [Thiorhodovibrio winogradskyi]|uniref:Transcriptional regulatory protein ZraR n=1 Tax=Thiorhodovibrio winogradskyi TaxID=77007 RepID=A0ABZ0SAJ9_9GAMM|nr:sigma-54 dependent transcriptional regulator [Thiorhodovibrio winogradskyi]